MRIAANQIPLMIKQLKIHAKIEEKKMIFTPEILSMINCNKIN